MQNLIKTKIVVNPDQTVTVVIENSTDFSKCSDVHTFDKQYTHNLEFKFEKEYKIKRFNFMKNEIDRLKIDCSIIKNLDLIINNIDNDSNYDRNNNLKADDLLVGLIDVLEFYTDEERFTIYLSILEQLSDIDYGVCAEGRCTRLYQIYKSLI